MKRKKLKARAMLYAILISLLIAMIAGALVSLSFGQRTLQERAFWRERLMRNADSGLQLLLGLDQLPRKAVDLYGKEQDSVLLSKRAWGLFEIATAQSFHGRDSVSKSAMIGLQPYGKLQSALYLADGNTPLAICGETEIRGKAFLPRAGVKRGRVAGQYYNGKELIYGTRARSQIALIPIQKAKLEALQNLKKLQIDPVPLDKEIEQSFEKEAKMIRGESLNLNQLRLKGQLLIVANKEIYVGANSVLEDVILVAPKIKFESGFRGNLQALATDSLIVGQDCHFEYPSSLGLLKEKSSDHAAFLKIDSLSTVQGVVWLKELVYNRKKARANIAPETLIEGDLYIDGYLDVKGNVYGHLSVKKFSLRTAASVYENHILDVKIDYNRRHKSYLLPDFWEQSEGAKKGIVKWLD